MSKRLFATLLLITSMSTQAKDIIINIPNLVGKSKPEVSQVIGKPTSCVSSKYGQKCKFAKADTEIVFIKGKADWITVEGIKSLPFTDDAIEHLGFKPHGPSFSNSTVKRWESLQGLLSVSVFSDNKNSDYAYIKSYTK